MYIPCDKTFPWVPIFLTLTLKFDLLLKNFNLGNSFLTRIGRAFIFHMCIPCSKTFNAVPWFLKKWPWPWRLTYFIKNWPGLWLLNQRGYLLLLFTYGCRRRAMLSFWQLWLLISSMLNWLRKCVDRKIPAILKPGCKTDKVCGSTCIMVTTRLDFKAFGDFLAHGWNLKRKLCLRVKITFHNQPFFSGCFSFEFQLLTSNAQNRSK